MVIKGFKLTILIKSIVIIYTVNLQYISVIKVVNINNGSCSCKVQNRGSSTLFLFFFYLLLRTLFFLRRCLFTL